MAETKIYPNLAVENNKKPNRFYAFPFIGVMVKLVLLIPVFIEIAVLGIVAFIALFINWFFVLFTGKYWDAAYKLFLGLFRLGTKVKLFIWGITDKYPGFTFDTNKLLELDFVKPEKPNRWLAIPFIGVGIRFILLIPYLIFTEVMERGSGVAMVISWFAVTFKGKFPESLYEFEKDSLRVSLATSIYLLGLSDKYPSFAISMNHQTIKILLIIAGAILTSASWKSSPDISNNNSLYEYSYESDYDNSPAADEDYRTY